MVAANKDISTLLDDKIKVKKQTETSQLPQVELTNDATASSNDDEEVKSEKSLDSIREMKKSNTTGNLQSKVTIMENLPKVGPKRSFV